MAVTLNAPLEALSIAPEAASAQTAAELIAIDDIDVLEPLVQPMLYQAHDEPIDEWEAAIETIRQGYEGSVEIEMLAKLLYREARGVKSDTEKAAVVWCVLNRVDDRRHPNTIRAVITRKNQFAWANNTPVHKDLKALALDVVIRWELEKLGYDEVGRVLPAGYLFFHGRNGRNWFRDRYRGGKRWNWSLPSPYEGGEALLGAA
jgi:hypothetical protein